ncbi:hypothetical protein B566_EDAN007244 [Ephemera danica]|nr:hypothetical protein B566_EDAN007244 [Ephemera danica]
MPLAIRRINLSYVIRLSLFLGVFTVITNITADDASEKKNTTEFLMTRPPNKPIEELPCPSGVECHKLGDPCISCIFNYDCTYGAEINVTCKVKSSSVDCEPIEELPCPSGVECHKLGDPCISCIFNYDCTYGAEINVTCKVKSSSVDCEGNRTFERSMICRYCYQTDPSEYTCIRKGNCNSVASPREYYQTNCTVHSEVLCLGKRRFRKNLLCNWTGGYRWSTALLLSITLGGFGADSFGGLGVWTLVDVVLIWLHYLGPADGSLYI